MSGEMAAAGARDEVRVMGDGWQRERRENAPCASKSSSTRPPFSPLLPRLQHASHLHLLLHPPLRPTGRRPPLSDSAASTDWLCDLIVPGALALVRVAVAAVAVDATT